MEKIFTWIKNNTILIGILILAFVLRIYNLDFQSVWLDEVHTINESNPNFSFSQLHQALLGSDPHPPLYFVLVQLFFKLFGYSEFVLRLFSVFVGLGGIVAIYHLGKELINKNVGIIATLFTAVNYFHLYYSQEGRMYAFMFLTTIFSFLFLVKFIKSPSIKSSVLYGIFTALMIYSHFFALFALVSQCFILLYFLIFPPNQIKRLQFFKLSALAGILIGILYIPSVELLIQTAQRDSFWIPKPEKDAYIQIFKDFFGRADVLIYLMTLLIGLFFVRVFMEFKKSQNRTKITKNKYVFTFFILFVWIFITLLIPWIRSHISVPMIIDRYFINVLPVIIIAVSVGADFIQNKYIKGIVVLFVVLFSLNHIIKKQDYYNKINKTQFREVTSFISENNENKDVVVSSLGWYLPYFLNNSQIATTIITSDINTFVDTIKKDSDSIKSFWYFDAHNRPFNPNEETKKYIEENFVVDKEIELFDSWAKHFISKYTLKEFDLSQYTATYDDSVFKHYIDPFSVEDSILKMSGFIYRIGENSKGTTIKIIVFNDSSSFEIATKNSLRPDVTEYFKSENNLDYSGFETTFDISVLPKGKYTIGLVLENPKFNQKEIKVTDKTFSVE